MVAADELKRLYADVEWAKDAGLSRRELGAALKRLYQAAPKGSDYRYYAICHLSSFLVRDSPFKALSLCIEGLKEHVSAELECTAGIAHLLLKHDNSAEAAFRRALQIEPNNISCLHNLGHLLDLARDKQEQAIVYLQKAHELAPDEPELQSSLAHALLKLGRRDEARALLNLALDQDAEYVEHYLRIWSEP